MLIVVAIGILTFFVPLVSIDPPVAGRRLWSPFQVVEEAYAGNLPQPVCERCGEPAVRAFVALPFVVTLIYLLMLSALVPLSVPYASGMVSAIAIFAGLDSLYLGKGGMGAHDFAYTFYGSYYFTSPSRTVHVHAWPLQFALLAVTVALFVAADTEVVIRRSSPPRNDAIT